PKSQGRNHMDMRALKVGQKVTLSDVLAGVGAAGVVSELTKWHVTVCVDARIDGVDGAYCVEFDYNNNVSMFYGWTDRAGWDGGNVPAPVGLEIVGLAA